MRSTIRIFLTTTPVIFALLACLLPGMIPLSTASQPDMEKNTETLIEILNGDDWVALGALVAEQYTVEDYSKPGTLAFTAEVTNEKPVYFSYGWCAVDEDTLRQNFEHITVEISINGEKLGGNNVHNLSFTSPDGLACLDFGVLLSNWEPGEYELKVVAVFDEKINDGLADYKSGEYVLLYNVMVNE